MISILDREIPRPQPMEVQAPPLYEFDKKGTQVLHDEHGKWTQLDIEDGHIIALNTFTVMQRAINRTRVLAEKVAVPAKYL